MSEVDALKEAIQRDCLITGNPTQTGTNFCRWVLSNLYDLTSDESDDALCGGANDGGIDAFFERYGTLTLLQSKYSENDHLSKILRLIHDVKNLEENNLSPKEQSQLKRVLEALNDMRESGAPFNVKAVYVTAEAFTEADEKKRADVEANNPDLTILDLAGLSTALIDKVSNISPRWQNHFVTIKAKDHFIQDGICVASVSISEIAKLAKEASEYLFASNVRHYLRATKVNKGMKDTLQKKTADFWVFNNGITITCSSIDVTTSELRVKAPQVVNGCQTVSTIRDVAPSLNSEMQKAGSVLVRIIEATKEERRAEITRYTNSQNSVRGKDLFALEKFQKEIKHSLRDAGYIYEIQRGQAATLKTQERAAYKPASNLQYLEPKKWNRQIAAIEAIQAIAATRLLRPEIAYASSQQLTPLGEYYDELFPVDSQIDHRYFYLPHLVVLYAKENLGYGRGGMGWRSNAHYMFASAFHVLVGIENKITFDQDAKAASTEVSASHYERLLMDEHRAAKILSNADIALEAFFDDGKVEDILTETFQGDIKNLLKRPLINSAWWPTFLKKVKKLGSKTSV